MALGAVGEELDQRRPGVRAGAVGRPALGGVDRERVVAIDPQPRDPVADRARREGRPLGPGDPRKARDRPLVVGDVEHDRRVVHRGESQRGMEVALGGRALPYPARRDPAVAFHRARHREPGRLRELGPEVARDGEEVHRSGRVEDRELAALQLVGAVRVDLVDHLEDRIAARDHAALLAVRGEDHVLEIERLGGAGGGRLFAAAFEVEAGLALPLGAVHAVVERAGQSHQPQQLAQLVGRELGVPRAMRLVVLAEHADQVAAQRKGFGGRASLVRPRLGAGFAQRDMREVDRVAGAEARLGHVQRQARAIGSGSCLRAGHF
jgi:hypothetical protein